MKHLRKVTVALAVLTMAFALLACGKKDSIVGSWKISQDGTEVTYEFKDDGTGSLKLGDISVNTEYQTEGDKLKLKATLLGETDETEYTYSVKDGKLTLTQDGESLTLTKQ